MALSDYDPIIQWYADSLADLDEPTGTTKSNPSTHTDPTLAGSPDSYADFGGTNAVAYTPVTATLEVGTGDVTIAMKCRVDSFVANDYIWENYDGSGTTSTACGFRIKITAGSSRRIALCAPPSTEAISTGVILETATNTLTAGQDFIVAFKRAAGTWTVWVDANASGGMVAETPNTNGISTAAFTECGLITFGSNGQGTTSPFDGRIYWLVAFDDALSDADIQLAAWDDEANLKAAWLSAGGGGGGVNKLIGKFGGKLVGKAA